MINQKPGSETDEANGFQKEMLTPIRHTAINLLSRRDHTKKELALKLLKRGYEKGHIRAVLNELDAKKLLNDQRFTENYIFSKANKGFGPERISRALQSLGIPEDIIAKQLTIADNDWPMRANVAWQKHFKGKHPKNYAEKAKQMRFLQYRGFTREQVCHLFDDEEM